MLLSQFPHKDSCTLAVTITACGDLNDDLTIAFNGITEALSQCEPGEWEREMLLEAQRATQRMVWKVAGLLNYIERQPNHPRPVCAEIGDLADCPF